MRNVTRSSKPPSLRSNAAKWTRDLLAALRATRPDRARIDRLLKRYRCDDVRTALDTMYGNLCCYCEATIGVVAFEHIEHRMPKAIFPGRAFDWGNLHLGCPKCNQAKADKWNKKAPILDSTATDPQHRIEKHLRYRWNDALACLRLPVSKKGQTTIDHADLNREKLRDARTKVAHGVLHLIGTLNEAPKSPQVTVLRLELTEKIKGQFGSLVKWLVDTYLKAA